MKKVLATVLAVVMAVGVMATTAFAADTTTITVPDDNRSYEIYQIFVGDLATVDQKKVLSNVKWGINGVGTTGDSVPDETLDTIAAITGTTDKAKLAVLSAYYNLTGTPVETVAENATSRSVTVPTGYYLIMDKGPAGDGEEISQYIVQVVGPTEITPKRGNTTTEKKVDDKNDTTGAEDAITWQDSADHDIGDQIPFQLKAEITDNYAEYDKYYFAFHDKESSGLTFQPDTVEVFVDGNKITSGYSIKTNSLQDDCTFEIQFEDLKAIDSVHEGSTITVTYKSELNSNAIIGSLGNPNEMYGEFSNNPHDNGRGKTPKDTVIVFTYKLDVNKYKDSVADANKLNGAGFALFKQLADQSWAPVKVTGVNEQFDDANGSKTGMSYATYYEIMGNDSSLFTYKGLDDGMYKLVETTTPSGYNTVKPIEFNITATHDTNSDDPALQTLTVTPSEKFEVEMTEADTPKPTGNISTDVINDHGSTLPETGGIGTTIFYVLGGVLVLGAGILLIAKKRMSAEE